MQIKLIRRPLNERVLNAYRLYRSLGLERDTAALMAWETAHVTDH